MYPPPQVDPSSITPDKPSRQRVNMQSPLLTCLFNRSLKSCRTAEHASKIHLQSKAESEAEAEAEAHGR